MSRLSRMSVAAAVAATALAMGPAAALGDSASHSFLLVAEGANVGVAANGETIEITCEAGEEVCGTFSVHPKAIEASGEFAHFLADGSLFATGTWTATDLISFHAYGCGEVFGTPIPPDLCGGAVKFAATFSTPLGELDGTITVFCIVGPKAPSSLDHAFGEGVTVVVPGIINFNHPGGGDNIYIQTS
ncbi:MAG: hypothetical protein ABJC24_00535 [Chloroflexota bacterium]